MVFSKKEFSTNSPLGLGDAKLASFGKAENSDVCVIIVDVAAAAVDYRRLYRCNKASLYQGEENFKEGKLHLYFSAALI